MKILILISLLSLASCGKDSNVTDNHNQINKSLDIARSTENVYDCNYCPIEDKIDLDKDQLSKDNKWNDHLESVDPWDFANDIYDIDVAKNNSLDSVNQDTIDSIFSLAQGPNLLTGKKWNDHVDFMNNNGSIEDSVNQDTIDSIFSLAQGPNLLTGKKWDDRVDFMNNNGSIEDSVLDKDNKLKEDDSLETTDAIFHSSGYLNTLTGVKWDTQLKIAEENWNIL